MNKRKKQLATSLFFGLVLIVGLSLLMSLQKKDLVVVNEVIQLENGFGYKIYDGNKLLIRQEFIPAIKGEKPFKSHSDAQKVADLIANKIRKGTSPRIEKGELVALGIISKD